MTNVVKAFKSRSVLNVGRKNLPESLVERRFGSSKVRFIVLHPLRVIEASYWSRSVYDDSSSCRLSITSQRLVSLYINIKVATFILLFEAYSSGINYSDNSVQRKAI